MLPVQNFTAKPFFDRRFGFFDFVKTPGCPNPEWRTVLTPAASKMGLIPCKFSVSGCATRSKAALGTYIP